MHGVFYVKHVPHPESLHGSYASFSPVRQTSVAAVALHSNRSSVRATGSERMRGDRDVGRRAADFGLGPGFKDANSLVY